MASIIQVLTQNIFPIFLVAGFGFALRRWRGLDKHTLSSVVFYCLSPCLVFSLLVNSQLPGEELTDLALFTVAAILSMGLLGFVVARLLRFERRDTTALMILLMFVNGGNYGLTLNRLRFGDEGLARAMVYYVTSTLMLYTIGVFLASMGQLSWRQTLAKLGRLPVVYAAVLAVLVYRFSLPVPAPLMRGIEVAGAGAIPVMILVLGMQMADLHGQFHLRLAIPAVTLRLLLGPVLAVLLATVLGLQGLSRSTAIIEASMPPAVITIILATEFDLQATAVTSIVVVATLLSPLTLALTINLLGL
ncbi:MAG: AEC family transporter [Ardenticatenaceae bacterium]|nr:AEC family transporter [Ardenticatenaceae bacterium]